MSHAGVRVPKSVSTSWWKRLVFAVGLLTCALTNTGASEPDPEGQEVPHRTPLRVAISHAPPFVDLHADLPRGFSIDLWEKAARHLDVSFRYEEFLDVRSKLEAVKQGDVDLAIGGISVTLDREQALDFTHPVFRTGLDIAVPPSSWLPGARTLRRLMTPTRLGIIVSFVLLIVTAGHVIWWAERGRETFDERYPAGVLEGMYWAVVTASTVGYGDKAPVGGPGRAIASLLILVSLPLFAVFTAELASTLTLTNLEHEISRPEDLRRHPVAVVEGTTAEVEVRGLGARVVSVDILEEALLALEAHKVDALVHDAPVLEYVVGQRESGQIRTLGVVFAPQQYAYAIRQGSPLREPLDQAILRLRETGRWEVVRQRWFSGDLGR